MKRLKGVLDGLRPGSSGYQSQKDKSDHHTTLDTAPDAPTATDIDTVQEQLRPEHFKLAKVTFFATSTTGGIGFGFSLQLFPFCFYLFHKFSLARPDNDMPTLPVGGRKINK
ncbi:uncharacterized protein TNCV_1763801 [Trichonephila clavipes]|nr:uncharacterized protein TNCV_1763801 [Trichonephila clavipes]